MRGQGAVACGPLDFGREEGRLAALTDKGPAVVCLLCDVLDLHAAFQTLRPLVGRAECFQQGGVRRQFCFADNKLCFHPATTQLERRADIAKIRGKVFCWDAEVPERRCATHC